MPISKTPFTSDAKIEFLGVEYDIKIAEPQSPEVAIVPWSEGLRKLIVEAIERNTYTASDALLFALTELEENQLVYIIGTSESVFEHETEGDEIY